MPDVDGPTLMIAIQAVEEKMDRLQAEIDAAGEDDDPSAAESMLQSCDKAAVGLRSAYEIAQAASSNLPSYAALMARLRR